MTIKNKLIGFAVGVFLIMLAIAGLSILQLKNSLYEQKEAELKHITQTVTSYIGDLDARHKAGELTKEQAQLLAIETIKAMRYGDGDYFWINDREPKMIMHPVNAKLDGQTLGHIKDPNGVYLFNEFVKVVNQSGSGYVAYAWPKPGYEVPQPKLSYVEHFKAWDWIIGTGVYIDDLQSILINQVVQLLAMVAFLVVIVLLVSWRIINAIVKPLNAFVTASKHVQLHGDFNARVKVVQMDEVGQVANVFNELLASTQTAIAEANRVMNAISKGQFDKRITTDLKGDLNILKQGVNGSADSVDFTMSELSKVMKSLYNGDFSIQMDERVEGEFRTVVQNAMSAMNATVDGIIKVMDKMENGKFQRRVEVEARGDMLRLKNGINRSMDALENAMKDITRIVVAQSEGDLTHKISADYHGELRVLKDAINTTADKLVEVVVHAVETSQIVSGAAQEVSDGSTSLSQRVQEQAASLEQTSATMDEMSSVVQSNTKNARQTAQVAMDVQNKASQGAAVMKQTIEAMNSIQESSHKIGDIVSLIDGIAFQTNLLALNAAVEAARAGDHGRGFAVVAGEVRALAQKSADAAKDIKRLINESVGRIDQGTKLASESGEVLKEINDSINGVAEMINQIAQASSEQADGIKQVHNAIEQIDGVTQQNAALVEETSAAAESLSEQARILQQDMAFFKTDQALGRQSAPKALAKPAKTDS